MSNNRTRTSTKSIGFALVYYFLDLALRFATRTIFIYCLTVEMLGLNGLFSNILSMLSLVDLGIGVALTFVMYKPMGQGDYAKVFAIHRYYKKIYTIIVGVILVLSILLIPALPYTINGNVPSEINIYVIYFVYVLNTCFSYFSAPNKSLLIAAQRNDLNSVAEISKTLSMNVIQMIVLLLFKNYYVYVTVLPLSSILEYFITYIFVKKKFARLFSNTEKISVDSETKTLIGKNAYALIFHKIGGVAVFGTDNIIISSLLGLTVLGIYSNYYLIIAALNGVLGAVLTAVKGSVGNVIATETHDNIYKLYKKLEFIYIFIIGFCTSCLLCLFQPFMREWMMLTGENINEMLFSTSTVFLLVISFLLQGARKLLLVFKECAGLNPNDKYRAVWEAALNIVVSVVLCKLIGINGVILGTIISCVFGPMITEPYVTYKHLFKVNVFKYFLQFGLYLIAIITTCVVMWFLSSLVSAMGILTLILKFIVVIVGSFVCLCVFLSWTKEFKITMKWGFNLFKNIKKH